MTTETLSLMLNISGCQSLDDNNSSRLTVNNNLQMLPVKRQAEWAKNIIEHQPTGFRGKKTFLGAKFSVTSIKCDIFL